MNYFETVLRTMDATFSGVLVVKNPTIIVGDTGSNPSLGRFCLSPEQLNAHTATREDKRCTWRKPTGSSEDLLQPNKENHGCYACQIGIHASTWTQKIYGPCKGCLQTLG